MDINRSYKYLEVDPKEQQHFHTQNIEENKPLGPISNSTTKTLALQTSIKKGIIFNQRRAGTVKIGDGRFELRDRFEEHRQLSISRALRLRSFRQMAVTLKSVDRNAVKRREQHPEIRNKRWKIDWDLCHHCLSPELSTTTSVDLSAVIAGGDSSDDDIELIDKTVSAVEFAQSEYDTSDIANSFSSFFVES
ncbi:hypothetical protein L1987_35400 [Smallanthus sonchifolius]|uniref:Uncharacterized protein n=1 Tax=Smallanthus sonchifolius TaxID=185202 RepID=A0ACB9HW87_9ASTR|nr:hypothetical protein L1987_35400 [Smallanthus sonchifolius]